MARDWDIDDPDWQNGLYLYGQGPLEEWLDALQAADAPPPEEWTNYDVLIDESGRVDVDIRTQDGETFTYPVFEGDLKSNLGEWDWTFTDIWEWLADHYPNIQRDSEYAE